MAHLSAFSSQTGLRQQSSMFNLLRLDKYYLDNPEILLKKDVSKIQFSGDLDKYLRLIRQALKEKIIQNDFLLKKESYIPLECPVYYPFNREPIEVTDIELPNRDWLAITITFDQQKHPQLIITPSFEQKKYIEKVISNLLYEQHITAVYGSFEKHKSGYIHSHLIIPHYGSTINLLETITSYFTNRTIEKQHAVLIKDVTDISKWIGYINKESQDYFEFNLRKNTIEI